MGWYEKKYTKGTRALAEAIRDTTAHAVIGGGDTGASIEKIISDEALSKRVFISTGGGATLEYLAHGTLPGITALS